MYSNLCHVPMMSWWWTVLRFAGGHRHGTNYLGQYVHLKSYSFIKAGTHLKMMKVMKTLIKEKRTGT